MSVSTAPSRDVPLRLVSSVELDIVTDNQNGPKAADMGRQSLDRRWVIDDEPHVGYAVFLGLFLIGLLTLGGFWIWVNIR